MNNEERQKIYSEWESTQLLQFVPESTRIDLASCLEGQRLVNEISAESDQWKRISLPIIVRIYKNLPNLKGSHLPLSREYTVKTTKNSIDVVFDLERQEFERLADALTLEIISLLDNKTLILHNLNCTDSGIISMNYDLE